jgi:hypothetical protein
MVARFSVDTGCLLSPQAVEVLENSNVQVGNANESSRVVGH